MKKRLLIPIVLALSAGTVNAAADYGQYEGYPVVKVLSNGEELAVKDVPAINFHNRTLVPLYMLRDLGAEVEWDSVHYSVDVRLPETNDKSAAKKDLQANKEMEQRELVKVAYERLNHINLEIWLFAQNLHLYAGMDDPMSFVDYVNEDYQKLIERHREVQQFTSNAMEQLTVQHNIQTVYIEQLKLLDEIGQTKSLFSIWANSTGNVQMKEAFDKRLLFVIRAAKDQITQTQDFIHQWTMSGF